MPSPSVLIIGCGSIGERHLRCFQRTGRGAVTACDQNTALLDTVAARYSVATVGDWREALRSRAHQAVVICTPAPLHVPMASEALALGVHTLIEKPLSHSLDGVDALLDAARSGRAQVSVAYVLHVHPALRAAREFLGRGELGRIRQVVFTSGQPFHLLRPAYASTYYRDRKTGGGAIQDALTHWANWIESVVGPTDSVLCDCAHQALAGVAVEDTVHLSARNGDVLVSYALNQFQPPNESFLQFNADRGSLRIELHRPRWGTWASGATDWSWHETPVADRDVHFIAQADAFLDQIEGKPARLCTLEAAAQTLRFNLAALASAESGTRVNCRDVHG